MCAFVFISVPVDVRHALWAFRYGVRMALPFAATVGILEQFRISLSTAVPEDSPAISTSPAGLLENIACNLAHPFHQMDSWLKSIGDRGIDEKRFNVKSS